MEIGERVTVELFKRRIKMGKKNFMDQNATLNKY